MYIFVCIAFTDEICIGIAAFMSHAVILLCTCAYALSVYLVVFLSVFAYSRYIQSRYRLSSTLCGLCVSEVGCVINVPFGADGAGPGKLYCPRGGRLIPMHSLEPFCL